MGGTQKQANAALGENVPNDNLVWGSQFGAMLNLIYRESVNYILIQHDIAS